MQMQQGEEQEGKPDQLQKPADGTEEKQQSPDAKVDKIVETFISALKQGQQPEQIVAVQAVLALLCLHMMTLPIPEI